MFCTQKIHVLRKLTTRPTLLQKVITLRPLQYSKNAFCMEAKHSSKLSHNVVRTYNENSTVHNSIFQQQQTNVYEKH